MKKKTEEQLNLDKNNPIQLKGGKIGQAEGVVEDLRAKLWRFVGAVSTYRNDAKSLESLVNGFEKDIVSSQRKQFRQRVEGEMDKYKCDFNWDFSAPRGGKPKHKSYIAIDDVLKALDDLKDL